MSINRTEIILETFRETFFWPISPNFVIWRHFGPQNRSKWPNFDHFHQKWHIFTKLTPLMSVLTKYMSINPTQISSRTQFFEQFPQILTYYVIFAPKMTQFEPFSPKWYILTKLTPSMTFLTKYMSIKNSRPISPTFDLGKGHKLCEGGGIFLKNSIFKMMTPPFLGQKRPTVTSPNFI